MDKQACRHVGADGQQNLQTDGHWMDELVGRQMSDV